VDSGDPAASSPPPRRGLPTWAFALIVVGATVIAFLGVCVILIPHVVSKPQELQRKLACMNNLSQLAQAYLVDVDTNKSKVQIHSGPALWLGYYKTAIKSGEESVFVCAGDPSAKFPTTAEDRAAYEHVDLDHVPRELCSYAGRDFERCPLDKSPGAKNVLGACLHHKGCAVIVTDAGDAMYLRLEELGLDSDDDKSVGPDSKSPVLRVLRYDDGSVR
jgi:hypothetical protein